MATMTSPKLIISKTLATRVSCAFDRSLTRTFSTSTRSISTPVRHIIRPQSLSRPRCFFAAERTYATAAPNTAVAASDILSWNEFLTIRRRRRFANLGMSVVGGLLAITIGAPMIGQNDLDTKVAEATGIDAIYVLIGGSLCAGMAGWFGGRVVGGTLFSTIASARGWRQIFLEKEKSLFHRIKRYRADPASSSPQNPIPDYYGEKISSVAGYRQWLKDQRAFNKKMYRGNKPVAA